jgi:hypothetical protein
MVVNAIDVLSQSDRKVRRELVDRVVSSSALCRSARLRDLFLYLCARVLDDGVQDIHELEVGHKVFSRPEQYDTIADNIVRVHASMLRKRLSEYFQKAGRDENFVIEIPKGNYAPLFRERPPAHEQHAKADLAVFETLAIAPASWPEPLSHPEPVHPAAPSRSRSWALWAVSALAVVFAALSLYLSLNRRSAPPAAHAALTGQPTVRQFWSGVFQRADPSEVVLDDAALDFYQDATNHPVALDEYYDRSYLSSVQKNAVDAKLDPARVYALMLSRQSSFAAASQVWRLAQIAGELGSPASLQFARDLSFRQVKSGNVILLGNPQSNPWIQPFEPRLSILWVLDRVSHSYFPEDKTAPDAQRDEFRAPQADPNVRAGYASIAFLPNLSGTGNTLILTATGGAAMGEALDLLSDENSMKQLRSKLPSGANASFPYFEILLKTVRGSKELHSVQIVICRSPVSVTALHHP